MSEARKFVAGFVVTAVVAVMPFGRSVNNGMVNLDDPIYVCQHPEVVTGLTWKSVRWAFATGANSIWMPLTRLSYMLDWDLSGVVKNVRMGAPQRVFSVMHAQSVVWHALNSGLLFVLLAHLFPVGGRRFVVSVGAALLWALHPLRCESVCWIASRKDVMSMFFLILGSLFWVRYRQGCMKIEKMRWAYALSILFPILGALCKPSVMIFPALYVILDMFVLRYRETSACWVGKSYRLRWDTWMLPYLLPVLAGMAIAIEGTCLQHAGGAMASCSASLMVRLVNAVNSIGIYVRNFLWPDPLGPQCMMRFSGLPRDWWYGLPIGCGVLLLLGLRLESLRLSAWRMSKPSYGLAGLSIFVVCLVPFLGIAGFGVHAYADRFTYIPMLGASVATGGFCVARERRRLRAAAVGITLWVVTLAGLSYRQTGFWKDDGTIWFRTLLADGRESLAANLALGSWYYEYPHDVEKSIEHFSRVFDRGDQITSAMAQSVYMLALNEANKRVEAERFLKVVSDWNQTDIRKGIEKGEYAVGAASHVMTMEYALCRIACLMLDPVLRKAAEEETDRYLKNNPTARDFLYMKGRLAELRGDNGEARRLYADVLEKGSDGNGYVHYTFLKRKLEGK